MEAYTLDVEQKMKRFFDWLSEKDRRRYAAVESAKLGMAAWNMRPASYDVIRRLFGRG